MKNLVSQMKEVVLVTGFFLILALIITWPGIRTFSSKFIGVGGDSYQYAGFQMLVVDQWKAGKIWPFSYSDIWRYPYGANFSRGYDSALSNLVGGALILVTGNYVFSYNLVVISSLLFNSMAAYGFFKKIVKDKNLAVLGSVISGLSFYVMARATGHLNLVLVGGMYVFAASLWELYKKQDWQNYWKTCLSLVLVGYGSAQYFVMVLIVAMVVGGLSLFFYKEELLGFLKNLYRGKVKLLASMLVALILFLPIWLPIMDGLIRDEFVWRTDHDYSPALMDLVTPNPFLPVMGNSLNPKSFEERNVEHVVFLGFIEMGLFLWVMAVNYRKKVFKWILALVIVFLIFSLGTVSPDLGIKLPYGYLINYYPFAAVSEPGRFVIWVSFFMALVIILGLRQIKNKKVWVSLMIGLLIFERISGSGFYTTDDLKGDYIDEVKDTKGEAVMDIPLYDSRNSMSNFIYGKKSVDGYLHWLGDTKESRRLWDGNADLNRFICQNEENTFQDMVKVNNYDDLNKQMLTEFSDFGIKTIVIHKDYGLYYEDRCSQVLAQTNKLFPPIMIARDIGFREAEDHVQWADYVLNTGLFFPKKGKVKINKIHLSSSVERQNINLRIGSKDVDLSHWNFGKDKEIWMSPKDLAYFWEVKAGDKFLITGDVIDDRGFVTIWYDYDIEDEDFSKRFIYNGMEKVYEDRDKEVLIVL